MVRRPAPRPRAHQGGLPAGRPALPVRGLAQGGHDQPARDGQARRQGLPAHHGRDRPGDQHDPAHDGQRDRNVRLPERRPARPGQAGEHRGQRREVGAAHGEARPPLHVREPLLQQLRRLRRVHRGAAPRGHPGQRAQGRQPAGRGDPTRGRRRRGAALKPWLRLLVAAATGAAVLIVELMAVRLMAPWFGTSQLVWTNVIGVVLAALAAGQWLGGRWAERRRGAGPAALLLAAGGLALALPEIVDALSGLVRPDGLGLEEAFSIVTWGSLLVALVAVGAPMAALGAVTPWLVRLSDDAGQQPGRVAGTVLAAGTLGSLVGAFGATHVLLPALGSAGAVRLAGACLVLAALAVLGSARPGRTWVVLLLPLATAFLPRPAVRPDLLERVET